MKIKFCEQTTCKFTGHKQKWTQGEWLFIYTEECCLGLTVYKWMFHLMQKSFWLWSWVWPCHKLRWLLPEQNVSTTYTNELYIRDSSFFLFSSQELTHYSNADDVEVSFCLQFGWVNGTDAKIKSSLLNNSSIYWNVLL